MCLNFVVFFRWIIKAVFKIVKGKRAITPDTALRLAKFFNTSPQSWLNLQDHYDTELVKANIENELAFIPVFQFA